MTGSTKKAVAGGESQDKYKQKCKDLKRRIVEIDASNELITLAIAGARQSVKRLRLEYALLLDRLETRVNGPSFDSEVYSTIDIPSPPLSPIPDGELASAGLGGPSEDEAAASPAAGATGRGRGRGGKTRGRNSSGVMTPLSKLKPSAISSAHSNGANGSNGGANGSGGPPAKKKKVSRERDPNAPKRPQNAYMRFCDMSKDEVKTKLEAQQKAGDAVAQTLDLTHALSEAWKELGDEGRKPYFEMWERDRLEYLRQMVSYVPLNPTANSKREKIRAQKTLDDLEGRKEKDEAAGEAEAEAEAEVEVEPEVEAEAEAEEEADGPGDEGEAEAEAETEAAGDGEPAVNGEKKEAKTSQIENGKQESENGNEDTKDAETEDTNTASVNGTSEQPKAADTDADNVKETGSEAGGSQTMSQTPADASDVEMEE